MIDENMVQRLCKKYKLQPQIFQSTNTILIDTGLDVWKTIINDNIIFRPVSIYHQNILGNKDKFHFQRRVSNLFQAINVIVSHKGVVKNIFAHPITYKYNINEVLQ